MFRCLVAIVILLVSAANGQIIHSCTDFAAGDECTTRCAGGLTPSQVKSVEQSQQLAVLGPEAVTFFNKECYKHGERVVKKAKPRNEKNPIAMRGCRTGKRKAEDGLFVYCVKEDTAIYGAPAAAWMVEEDAYDYDAYDAYEDDQGMDDYEDDLRDARFRLALEMYRRQKRKRQRHSRNPYQHAYQ
eukprot:CAMPEP_0202711612 /NCGR_PEP_ID=MMETSP1385-20130828/23363_1 /ASSEMBLY_ACC=CAM_ASM_000861 /TAXON_ID=933848 /ORGANISM="Elphidium margaritaceum" /LENGTH=185 /DNA_ID=CAMNT_0049371371 /DNA_START=29 /DNA_END=586 /DNA_ORIENTATION=-